MIEAMLQSALRSAELAEETGLGHDRIIISAKVSGVRDLVDVYRLLAARCDYPLHLGLTEAGMGDKGIIASTAGLAILLNEGIGDTIRVSLTPEPGRAARARGRGRPAGPPVDGPAFVPAAGLGLPGLRPHDEHVLPGDGPADPGLPQGPDAGWRETHPGAEELRVAVMGCVVNGPGEASTPTSASSLPGTFEEPVAPVFIDGKLDRTLRGDGSSPNSSSSSRTTWRGAIPPGAGHRAEHGPRGRRTASPGGRLVVHASGCILLATERPLRDVGDPHVFF